MPLPFKTPHPEDRKNEQSSSTGEAQEHHAASPGTDPEAPQFFPNEQYEANGGPLGCCLGVTIGLLLSLTVGILGRFYASPLASLLSGNLSLSIRLLMLVVAGVAVLTCGYWGWRIGKRIYREYEPKPPVSRRK